ncbi:MAG: hypothetical protein ACRDO7_01370, partial [Nocardioidaceae bacterium]
GQMTLTRPDDGFLTERIARECESVIDAERTRLRRRRPQLSDTELATLDETLTQIAERLLLDALRRNPTLTDSVAPLFTTDATPQVSKEEAP